MAWPVSHFSGRPLHYLKGREFRTFFEILGRVCGAEVHRQAATLAPSCQLVQAALPFLTRTSKSPEEPSGTKKCPLSTELQFRVSRMPHPGLAWGGAVVSQRVPLRGLGGTHQVTPRAARRLSGPGASPRGSPSPAQRVAGTEHSAPPCPAPAVS